MQISGFITLTTDWGHHDFYTGMFKGRLVTDCPELRVIDLTNNVPSYNINHASFIIRHSYRSFPVGTIHVCMVNSDSEKKPSILYTQVEGHHFLVPDNGMLNLCFSEPPSMVRQVFFEPSNGFASLDCVVGLIRSLSAGVDFNQFGQEAKSYNDRIAIRATIDESIINGNIIYIDSYQNAISNISRSLFARVGQGRRFDMYVQSNFNHIVTISESYSQVDSGELLALFNSADLLEVAIRDGFAAQLLSISVGSGVRVKFR